MGGGLSRTPRNAYFAAMCAGPVAFSPLSYIMLRMLNLTVTQRSTEEKVSALRAKGEIPAVAYGAHAEAVALSVPFNEFIKVLREAGETSVVSLTGGKKAMNVMIHEVQRDPVTNDPIHIDFYVVEKGQSVEVNVPLEFVGVSPVVKGQGAVLVKVMHELAVEGDPEKMPHTISVDISGLAELDSQILASDITLPAGITLVTHGEEVVAAISAAQEEEEGAAVDMASIEVEKKGKKEETSKE